MYVSIRLTDTLHRVLELALVDVIVIIIIIRFGTVPAPAVLAIIIFTKNAAAALAPEVIV
jgi:hypothetical protein